LDQSYFHQLLPASHPRTQLAQVTQVTQVNLEDSHAARRDPDLHHRHWAPVSFPTAGIIPVSHQFWPIVHSNAHINIPEHPLILHHICDERRKECLDVQSYFSHPKNVREEISTTPNTGKKKHSKRF
jgi:hypothetical protein